MLKYLDEWIISSGENGGKIMKYSVDIERSVDSLTHCLKKINDEIENISD